MNDKGVEQKPSETALFAALRRTLANKDFKNGKFGPDDLAEHFLPPHFRFFLKFKKIRENTKAKLNGFLPGLNEYMIARTAYFDGLFMDALKNNYSQIVLLGAGYDSRAYRFKELNKGTKIFELDIPPTQNRKKEYLKKARIDIPQGVKLVPIDFNQESLKDILEKAGYKEHEKTLFIWEGVSYYLDAESVDATLEFVSHSSQAESIIAFDYTVSLSEENLPDYYGAKEFAQTMKEQHANEELLFSIEEGKIEPFLEGIDLKMIDHLNNEEIEKTFLTKDNGSLIGPITGHFRFVSASPKYKQR
jgi:methyltransferase (TIGR00027 family)